MRHGSNQPLKRARVTITQTDHPDQQVSLMTAEDGRFTFTNVPQGKYTLAAEYRGLQRTFEQDDFFSTGIVTGPALDSEHIVFPVPRPHQHCCQSAGRRKRTCSKRPGVAFSQANCIRVGSDRARLAELRRRRRPMQAATSRLRYLLCGGFRKAVVCAEQKHDDSKLRSAILGRIGARCGLSDHVLRRYSRSRIPPRRST